MKVYGLSSKADMGVRVSPEWRATVYAAVSCRRCHALLREAWDKPLDVDLDGAYIRGSRPRGKFSLATSLLHDVRYPDARGLAGPYIVVEGAQVGMVRQDVAADLRLAEWGFSLGRVTVDGIVQSDYVTLVAERAARIVIQNDGVTYRGECPECGRSGRGLDFYTPFWFELAKVAGRDVFSNERGKCIYVSDNALRTIRLSTTPELNIEEIEVRDMHGPDQLPD